MLTERTSSHERCCFCWRLRWQSDMELGHILWPSDPVTRESSDPETQLTRWPRSIKNSKCRLMLQTNVCNGQEVCQFLSLFGVCTLLESKVKFWRSFIKYQYFNDGWTDFHKKYTSYLYLGLFRKTEKLGSHTGSKWWPGDPDVKDDPNDPLTRWPIDPVPCLMAMTNRPGQTRCSGAKPIVSPPGCATGRLLCVRRIGSVDKSTKLHLLCKKCG